MAVNGKNAAFSLGGTTYDSDDCLQAWQLNNAINELLYHCSGVNKAAAGAADYIFTTSLALAASDSTKVSALDAGSTGAFIGYPAGNTSTYIKATATDALVTRSNMLSGPRNVLTYDLTIRLQDLTLGAVT